MQPPTENRAGLGEPETHFAPAERASADDVESAAVAIAHHAVIDHLLETYGGLLAVLNEQRQILAVNEQLLRTLGIGDAGEALGLRPGEALHCSHAHDHRGGCGTSRFCASCGAAIAIVVCLREGASAYRECVLDCTIDGQPSTLDLRVQATCLTVDGREYVLLYLQDVSAEKRRAAVERAFFHDINNLLAGLLGAVELLADHAPPSHESVGRQARSIVRRISKEFEVQRALSTSQPGSYRVMPSRCVLEPLVAEVIEQLVSHPAACDKRITMRPGPERLMSRTDPFLVARILTNMVLNALEATDRGGEVVIETGIDGDATELTVWNASHIPDRVAARIFQRYFSTKPGTGRGVGTFSMRLLAEAYLGGAVSFTTSPDDGTRFTLRIPSDFFRGCS